MLVSPGGSYDDSSQLSNDTTDRSREMRSRRSAPLGSVNAALTAIGLALATQVPCLWWPPQAHAAAPRRVVIPEDPGGVHDPVDRCGRDPHVPPD